MNIKIEQDREQTYADVDMGHGVVVELVRGNDAEQWEVWGVRLDGTLYRESKTLEGEPLQFGPLSDALDRAVTSRTQRNEADDG